MLDERRPSCTKCAELFWPMFELQGYDNPPCMSCKMPTLAPDNALAWEAFCIASTQMVVVGMGTALGLRFEAIDRAVELVGVHPLDRDTVWDRVRRLGEAYARLIDERSEAKKPAEQKRKQAEVQPPPMWPVNHVEITELDEEAEDEEEL